MTMHVCPKGHQSQASDYCDECGAPIGGARSRTGTGTPPTSQATTGGAAPMTGSACPDCGTAQAGRFCEVCGYDYVLASLGGSAPASTGTGTGASAPGESAGGAHAASEAASGGTEVGGAGPPAGTASAGEAAGDVPGGPASVGTATGDRVLPQRTPTARATGWTLTVDADKDYHTRMQAQAEPDADPIAFPPFVPPRRFTLDGSQALIGRRSRSRGIEPEIDLSGQPTDPAVSHAHALLVERPDGTWALVDLESANGTYLNDDPDPVTPNTPLPLADGDHVYLGAWTRLTVTHRP